MTTTPSLDSTGLTVLRTADVRENMVEAIEGSSQFGVDAQTGSDKVLGQILDVAADPIGQCYELVQSVFDGFDPDAAMGTLLENIAGLTGLTRQAATYSTVTLTLTGTPATVIAAGKRARVPDGGIFAIDAEATIAGGGTVDATATCTTSGAVEAAATSIDEIVDAVSGWASVSNAADAEEGEPIETDVALRLRRSSTFSAGGSCVVQSLRAALEELAYVTSASVVSNDTTATVDGVPAKSFLTVIHPDTADADYLEEIAETIWDHKPAGIRSYGASQQGDIEDEYGYTSVVAWDWAEALTMYASITITTDSEYPSNGDALVEDYVTEWGNDLGLGIDPYNAECIAYLMDSVPGIKTFSVCQFKVSGGAYADTVAIEPTEITEWADTRVSVIST